MAHSRSLVLAVLLLLTILLPSVHALEVVNKRTCSLTVFAPPICEPCPCRSCVCTLICKFVPGVDVKPGKAKTIPVQGEYFPLQFLTVEVEGAAYNVRAKDLKHVTRTATVVVTAGKCGKKGVAARVFPNPKFARSQRICLVPGERYGS